MVCMTASLVLASYGLVFQIIFCNFLCFIYRAEVYRMIKLILVEALAMLHDNLASDFAHISSLDIDIYTLQRLLERRFGCSVDHLQLDSGATGAPANENDL